MPYGGDFPDSPSPDDQYPLTPEEDLRSFDSPLDDSFRFEDQYPLTPEEDLRSFDSPLDDSFRFEINIHLLLREIYDRLINWLINLEQECRSYSIWPILVNYSY